MLTRIRSLLVANRGEIAIRVMRAATELGIRTVAHLFAGRPLLAAPHQGRRGLPRRPRQGAGGRLPRHRRHPAHRASRRKADAIHPGYGFLSENPEFVEACNREGVIFVGPDARDHAHARQQGGGAQPRDVGRRAGHAGDAAAAARHRRVQGELAAQVGYPVMLKASWGGGGRGMRVIESDAQLTELLPVARREAQGRLRQRRGVSREAGAQGAAHRSADPRRHARQPRAPVRARLHGAAAQPESGRARAGGVPDRRAAQRAVRLRAADRHARSTTATPAPSNSCRTPRPASSTSSR